MSKNTLIVLGLVFGIAVLSALLTSLRAGSIANPNDLIAKGLATVRKETVIFYGIFLPVLVGVISFFVYRGIHARWPLAAESGYLWLAIGFGLVFTLMAAIVFKMRGFAELTALHILYVAGFGWIMPKLLS